ncbi:MAG: amino acid ABC transporter substrate-binding protein, partial [Desulfobacteraceae bacterium]|nr:amino acid ABC transporter substrate-binding protein [Desulfobacteraceae bacterium]
ERFAETAYAAGNPPVNNTLEVIEQRGKLLVGVDIPYGIMEYYDDSGNPVGIDMDIAKEIASRLEVSIKIRPMPFSKLFDSLHEGRIDIIISAVTITPERQKSMLFSVPYLNAGMSIAVRMDNSDITSLENLKDKKVGVLKGTIGEELILKSEHVKPSLVSSYENNEQRINDLMKGKLDAIIVHFLIKDLPSIKLVGEPLSESYYGIVTQLNNYSVIEEVNEILRDLKRSGKLLAIKQKYLSSDTQ